MITCPKCGDQLPDGAAFCNVCGTPIAQAAPQGAPQPVPGQQPMYQQQPELVGHGRGVAASLALDECGREQDVAQLTGLSRREVGVVWPLAFERDDVR